MRLLMEAILLGDAVDFISAHKSFAALSPDRQREIASALVVVAALFAAALAYLSGYLPAGNSAPRVSYGSATAVDGDSLRVGGDEIRLIGIDAPELLQTCSDAAGRQWACGREAQARLRGLLARGAVDCVARSKDQYGRTLANCSAVGVADIGHAMVRDGYAVNFLSGGYQATEAEARADKRGIWRGAFEPPQDWRRRQQQ
jgi:endonuclease YncB( thermonuclease family)